MPGYICDCQHWGKGGSTRHRDGRGRGCSQTFHNAQGSPSTPTTKNSLALNVQSAKVSKRYCNVLNNEAEQVDPGVLMYWPSTKELFRVKGTKNPSL